MRHIKGIRNQGNQNTEPERYAFDVFAHVYDDSELAGISPSGRVVAALKREDSRVQTRGFRQSVLDAIFEDALYEDYDDRAHVDKLRFRLIRRFGAKRAREILIERVEILDSWKNRDSSMIPDAFLIDKDEADNCLLRSRRHAPAQS